MYLYIYIYYMCVCVFIIVCGVPGSTKYFFALSLKGHHFRKIVIENRMCV